MAKLSGLSPVETTRGADDSEIEVVITGLRPGEKLFEELTHDGNLIKTIHPRIMQTQEPLTDKEFLESLVIRLSEAIENYDHLTLVEAIRSFAPTVSSAENTEDIFYQQMKCGSQQ